MFGHDDDYLDTLNQEELNKIIFDYALLDFETNFDRKYIPTWINEIFDNNLNLLPDETIPFSLFLAAFLPAMADLLSVNRIKVEMKNNGNLFPVNCYTIVVGDSSIGKGRVISLLNKTFNNVKCKGLYKDINGDIIINDQKFKSYGLEGKYKKLQQELLKKESEENEYTIGSKEYKQCKKNIEKKYAVQSDSEEKFTVEALRQFESRLTAGEIPFGGYNIVIDECYGYLKDSRGNEHYNRALNSLYSLYNSGDLAGASTKEEVLKSIVGLPVNLTGYCTPATLKTGVMYDYFRELLNKGLGRRLIFCYPSEDEIGNINPNSKLKLTTFQKSKFIKNTDNEKNKLLRSELARILRNTERFNLGAEHYLYYSDDAFSILTNYITLLADKSKEQNNSLISTETKNRFFKAFKIAPIMHALNNKFEDNVITVEDIRQAIYIVEYFSFHYERFLTGGGADDIDIILSIFKENKNKWLQMKDLTRHHDFKKLAFKGRTARQIMGIYENELTRRAEENGDVLKVESVGKSGTQYKLINKYIESPAEL